MGNSQQVNEVPIVSLTFCKDFGISGYHIMHALKYK